MSGKKPIIIFTKSISKANRKAFEDAGYSVVVTKSKFKVLGDGELPIIEGWALEFLSNNSTLGYSTKRDFGSWLVDKLVERAKEIKANAGN